MFWTRRTGHLSDEDLSAYIDGELSGARLESAARHLDACSDCGAALAALREVKALVSRLPEVEPSRSFVLTPSMAGSGQRRPEPAARRQRFVLVPAVALTLLVALFAVDLVSSTSSTSSDEAGTASQAVIAKDASSSAGADSGAGSAAAAPERSTFSAPEGGTPQAAAPAPSTSGPQTGQGIAPPTVVGPLSAAPGPTPSSSGPEAAQAPAPPVTGPVTAPMTGPATGGGGVPVPVPSTNPTTAEAPSLPSAVPAPNVAPPAPSTGGLSSDAAPAPLPETANTTGQAGANDGTSMRNSARAGDDGPDWLRIAEVLAAIAFLASFAYVFGPGLIKKGH